MFTQHLGNTTLGTELTGGIVRNFHCDNLTRLNAAFCLGGYEYLLRETAVVGDDKTDAALFLITTHHRFVLALQHFYHLTFQTSAAIFPGDLNQHLVAIEHKVHLPCTKVNVLALCQRHREAITITVALHTAVQQMHLVDQTVCIAAINHQLAVSLHGTQTLSQSFQLFWLHQIQVLRNVVVIEWFFRLAQQLKDNLSTGYRVLVICRFTLGMGIGNFAFSGHKV